MAKVRRKLVDLAVSIESRADPSKYVFMPGRWDIAGQMRARCVEDGIGKIFTQLRRIEDIALRTGSKEILAIFEEELEELPVHK